MKILCAYHGVPKNPGGILNHQEVLGNAFQEMGHTVDMRCLLWTESISRVSSEVNRKLKQERGISSDMLFDQELGWFWPASKRLPYKGAANVARWKEFASNFDIIIWQTPVPTKKNDTEGNNEWPLLYDLPAKVKQIGVVHDGNLPDSYPWVLAIAGNLAGMVGVHPCGFAGAQRVPVRSAMIPNPHWRPLERAQAAPNSGRNGWASVQTFKGWKHVPDLVRGVPYMDLAYNKVLAGGGIDYHYLTSIDKMKPAYEASTAYDPDLLPELQGQRIWDLAIKAGMKFHGYIDNAARNKLFREAKFMIDPSWSRKYAKSGDHFNRTPVEGIIAGCVPIARNIGVSDNERGEGLLFKPDENYVMIPWNATPKEFGSAVDKAVRMKEKDRLRMLENGWNILNEFDSRKVAERYIAFAKGKKPEKWYCVKGATDATMQAEAQKVMKEHFHCEL